MLLFPQEIKVKTQAGEDKTYIISKFPALAGREIVSQYPLSAIPKLGDYKVNEEIMLKLMAFVAVPVGDAPLALSTRALYDNHVPDWETGFKIEKAMLEYNCSFFGQGRNSSLSEIIIQKFRPMISKILTDSSVRSFLKDVQRSMNSAPPTP